MAADFISVVRNNTDATHAQKLINTVAVTRNAVELLTECQQLGYRMFNAPSDFAVFEEIFGIPTGQGQTVFNLINGTVLALNGSAQNANAIEFINRVG
jgi:hypothetical protein